MNENPQTGISDFSSVPPEYWLTVCSGSKAAGTLNLTPDTFEKFPILWLPEFPAAMEHFAQTLERLGDDRVISSTRAMRSEAGILRKLQAGMRQDFPQDNARLLEACAAVLGQTFDGNRRLNLLRALDLFRLSARIAQPDSRVAAVREMNEAIVRQRLAEIGVDMQSNLGEAFQLYERARSRFTPRSLDLAQCLGNEGNGRLIIARLGRDPRQNLETACRLFREAATMFPTESDNYRCLMNEGVARRALADLDVDREANLQAAARLAHEARAALSPTSGDFASCLMNEAVARESLAQMGIAWKDNLLEAIRLLKLAATIFTAGGRDFASCRMNEGHALASLASRGTAPQENFAAAIELFKQAREMFFDDPLSSDRCLTAEAHARVGLSDFNIDPQANLQMAMQLYLEAADRQCEMSPREAIHSYASLGMLCLNKDLREPARNAYARAIQMLEGVRATASQMDDRRWWMEKYIMLFKGMIESSLRLGRYKEALEYLERGRSRALFELLATEDLAPRNLLPEQSAAYSRMTLRIGELESLIASDDLFLRPGPNQLDRAHLSQLTAEREELSRQLRSLDEEVRGLDPDFLALAKPLRLDEMIELAKRLDRTLVLLWVGAHRAAVFFISSSGHFDHISLTDVTDDLVREWMLGSSSDPISRTGWMGTYLRYREGTVTRGEWMGQMERTLSLVYEQIMKPIHHWLDSHADAKRSTTEQPAESKDPPDGVTHRIALITGGALGLLPLQAACWRDKDGEIHYLVEHLEIAFAPSAWVLKRCVERERKNWLPILALGDPSRFDSHPLPFSVWETRQIEQLVGAKHGARAVDRLEPASATLQRVREMLPTHPVAHFSCHGQWEFQRPLDSALMLAGTDCLSLGELLTKVDMKQAKLVVLSACESATGYRPGGSAEEYLGLPAGFIVAGAQAVVGSLWSVLDPPTALLMKRLYHHLLDGTGASDALRQAQLWLLHLNRRDALAVVTESVLGTVAAPQETGELVRNYREWLETLDEKPFAHPYYWAAFAAFGSSERLFY